MPERDRKFYLVAGLAALIGIGFGFFLGRVDVRDADIHAQHQQDRAQQVSKYSYGLFPPWPSTGAPVGDEETYSGQDKTTQRDLAAQEWAAWISFWMLIVTGIGVVYVALTLNATRQANIGFKESAERQLRAYVACENVEFDRVSESQIHLLPVWKNTGQTPTRNAKYNFNLTILTGDLPEKFDFPDKENGTGALQIAAGQGARCAGSMIHPVDMEKIRTRERKLFVWGWIEYDDVFPGTPRRRTEFAHVFIPMGGNRDAWNNLGKHNGADEECMKKPKTG